MNKLIAKLLSALPLMAVGSIVQAGIPDVPCGVHGIPCQVSLPGALELAVVGAAVAIAVAIGRRKK